jgi:signal transduction histidine kinase
MSIVLLGEEQRKSLATMLIKQSLVELTRLAATDPTSEVRESASDALEQLRHKLRYLDPDVLVNLITEESLEQRGVARELALEETRAFIAHEMKTALSPLSAFAHLLTESLDDLPANRERIADFAQRIVEQSEAASEVVNRYVEYAQPLRPQPVTIPLTRTLEAGLQEVQALCDTKKIEINRQFAVGDAAQVDRLLIAQVWRNTLINAIEAMENGGKLTVATQQENGNIVVKISDTGIGIKPEHLGHVFELGFTTKTGRRGTGVGLALVRRIIQEAHHGRIGIANNPEGKGTTVTVVLPRATEESANGSQKNTLAHSG